MQDLTNSDVLLISGAGADSYRMAIDIKGIEAIVAAQNNCSVKELTKSMIVNAITTGMIGAFSGGMTIPGVGAVPGWAVGAASGAAVAAFQYGATCWW